MVQFSHSFRACSRRSLFRSFSSARLSLTHPSPNKPPTMNSYRCFSLCVRWPMNSTNSDPNSTGYKTYQYPSRWNAAWSMHPMIAAAPGGCTLPVHIMKPSAVATDSARVHQHDPKSITIVATMNADATVAVTQLYSLAAGFSTVPNASTLMVPHAPDMNGSPCVTCMYRSTSPSVARVTKHMRTAQNMSLVGRFWTSSPPRRLGIAMREYGSSARWMRLTPKG
mmetsp:Transcript_7062/g.28683  ORF Transcript_7062/g.28683 Transcript_7062/m.28683 type:complete len:224 (-) Transcript_7062:260-931(-)